MLHEYWRIIPLYWWIFPLVMMGICIFMIIRRRGSSMCGFCAPRDGYRSNHKSDTAMDILGRRYAGGEIDQAEYERMKENLTKTQRGA